MSRAPAADPRGFRHCHYHQRLAPSRPLPPRRKRPLQIKWPTLIVTGTRDTERTQFDTLTPIDVISAEAIKGSVSSELVDTLAQLVPSFNVQQQPSANGLPVRRVPPGCAACRQTRRWCWSTASAFTASSLISVRGAQAPDRAQIPAAAIKRIEVLRDGDSAQYGSDAIAGVINIILADKTNPRGLQPVLDLLQGRRRRSSDRRARRLRAWRRGLRGPLRVSGRSLTRRHARASVRTQFPFQAAHPNLDVPNPVQHWGLPGAAPRIASA